jgi:hypothetical protein
MFAQGWLFSPRSASPCDLPDEPDIPAIAKVRVQCYPVTSSTPKDFLNSFFSIQNCRYSTVDIILADPEPDFVVSGLFRLDPVTDLGDLIQFWIRIISSTNCHILSVLGIFELTFQVLKIVANFIKCNIRDRVKNRSQL